MSNNSHFGCANDISYLKTTDYRPSNSLYVNVLDANKFRQHLQHNGMAIQKEQLGRFQNNMKCCACESQSNKMVQFNAQPTCGKSPQKDLPGLDKTTGYPLQ